MNHLLAQADPNSLQNKILELERRLRAVELGFVSANNLSEISSSVGEDLEGEFTDLEGVGALQSVLLDQAVVGDIVIVSKGSGQLQADVLDTDDTINFGKEMTEGDWVKIQGVDNDGENNIEWLLVGELVEETTYNVTREVNGDGADAWASTTPARLTPTDGP
jgi:hypothetical protein